MWKACCILLIIFCMLLSGNPQPPFSCAMRGSQFWILSLKRQQKQRRRVPVSLHLNFSSRVPREVTDKAWMNSENSMRPSYGEIKGRDRKIKWPTDKMRVLDLQFFHDVLAALCWKRGQTFAPSPRLFLPCTWLSPEAEICHLWSLLRWMLLAPSLQVTAQKTTAVYSGATMFQMIPHSVNGHGR